MSYKSPPDFRNTAKFVIDVFLGLNLIGNPAVILNKLGVLHEKLPHKLRITLTFRHLDNNPMIERIKLLASNFLHNPARKFDRSVRKVSSSPVDNDNRHELIFLLQYI